MIRLLKRLADFLDQRFPAKVVVTESKFSELEARLLRCINTASGFSQDFLLLNARVDALATTIGGIKDVVTKASEPATVAAARRAAFIADGRMPE